MAPKKKVVTTDLSWPELQTYIMQAKEPDLLKMLEAEKAGKKRTQHLLRIHGRYNVLRAQREREALLK